MSEAKRLGKIPVGWGSIFRDVCSCGHPLMISDTLGKFWCSNPKCQHKLVYAAADMLNNLGVKGIGVEGCRALIEVAEFRKREHFRKMIKEFESLGVGTLDSTFSVSEVTQTLRDSILTKLGTYKDLEISHLFPLMATLEDHIIANGNSCGPSNFVAIQNELQKKRTFAEAVGLCALPDVGPVTAQKLFKGVNSVDEILLDMQAKGLNLYTWLQMKNNYRGSTSIASYSETIMDFVYELIVISEVFNLIPSGGDDLLIAITGSVSVGGKNYNRKAFLDFVKIKAAGKFNIIESSAYNQLNYVICDFPSGSAKYLEGVKRNILISADDFVKLLD